jgi:hypothetical protein
MAFEGPAQTVATPEQELALLREQIAQKEQELAAMRESRPREEIAHERILHHRTQGHETLAPGYAISHEEAKEIALDLDPESDDETINELRTIMETKGIKNAFSVLENLNSPHLEDDFHRFLVQYLVKGMPVPGFTEKQPAWKALHMTMYEIALPETPGSEQDKSKPLKELLSAMEQFYSGMFSLEHSQPGEPAYFTLELAVPVGKAHLMFYAAVPNSKRDLFEKQILAIFPDAHISVQPNDYNVFVQDGTSVASVATLAHPAVLPLKDYADFDYDPINSLLNAFGKISPENEGASLQILIKPENDRHTKHFRRILDNLHKGEDKHESLRLPETFLGEAFRDLGTTFFKNNTKLEEERARRRELGSNKIEIEQVEKKISTPILSVNMRFAVSSQDPTRAAHILSELESSFHQFENPLGNRIVWQRISKGSLRRLFHDISFRLFEDTSTLPLSLHELTTLYHFPPKGIESSPHLKQARFTGAAAPIDLPDNGIILGTNTFRGQTTQVRIAPEDRLRHLYVIGQTGAGKSGMLRTLIDQDIKAGNGVCFIDPHGNDILDVLATVPPERYEDVIYFDPAELSRPFGLNLLEYNPNYPEQKTFIVNEILAIFRRLYGDVPESMGPMFEQYFRNATLLVMEDPASGSTLMDIGRVLSNTAFRNLKLSRSMNPIVNQFWNEIATKAGGDSSLENIVPYITNKFDDFTANDFMRPIIGQQESSFNFRDIIDNKKILLVNLSKGRLGERNANLLGLILVGKLFMAALSRADNPRGDFAPFYFYIDEFQNITTDSIPGILSEARKYKLSLTIAHQFLAQIDEKIKDAVFGNVGSMSVFRVGQDDGEFFEKQFAPTFTATDFTNIENRSAYVKILAHGVPQKPFNIKTLDLTPGNPGQVDDLRQLSYLTHGRDRATVEALIKQRYLS